MDSPISEFTFTAIEIDPHYEFDAVRFFDFTRPETLEEARHAERWFLSAQTYPPSPFAARLVPRLEQLLGNHVNTSPKSKNGDDMNLSESDSDEDVEGVSEMDATISGNDDGDKKPFPSVPDTSMETFHNQMQKIQSGLSFCNDMIKDNFKAKVKSSVKPSFPRSSTLMKPTLSQLAKQKKAQQIGSSSRYLTSLMDKNQKNFMNHNVMEVQAPKRQKLEGGHLRKVGDTTQQSNFVHKDSKKDGACIAKSVQTMKRITVPREPDLATAHRAQRIRQKAAKETNDMTTPVSTFKAHPLNKKILECPSLLLQKSTTLQVQEFREFHFKTSERATQHSSSTSITIPPSNSAKVHKFSSTSAAKCRKTEPRRPNHVDTPRQDSCKSSHSFKALPINKKILTSKGDIGVFRNTKRETTVPMEFNFHTGKRVHHDLPIELFDKLSLAPDSQASTGSQLKTLRPNFLLSKGSKENRCANSSKEQEVKQVVKEKLAWVSNQQMNCGSNDRVNEAASPCFQNRNLTIR